MSSLHEPASWPERHFSAMGCHMSARLTVEPRRAAEPLAQVEALFANAEKCLSRFDPNSELSYLNAHASRWLRLSPLLWDVLAVALDMAEETSGLFDPTLLLALEAAGYTRSFEKMGDGSTQERRTSTDASPRTTAWTGGNWRQIRRRRTTHEVWLPMGTKLDLGGIAKGYVAQQAVMLLRKWGPALVNAGGDLVAGDPPPGFAGWPVAVAAPSARPHGESPDLAMIWLVNAALATSGMDYRRWDWHGRTMHHIIDPRSGQPAVTDLISATVLAPTAAQAEGWAKAALVLGQQKGTTALAARQLAGLLISGDGHLVVTPTLRRWLAWLAAPERRQTS
jgi:thiamine biosynthesis lipoprotein